MKRLGEKAVKILKDNVTLNLAYYELGNVIWKEHAVEGRISLEEALDKAQKTAEILQIMEAEEVNTSEEFKETMKLASELKPTFYDSAYIQKAKTKTLTLVTEDRELLEKARKANINTITINELTSRNNPHS